MGLLLQNICVKTIAQCTITVLLCLPRGITHTRARAAPFPGLCIQTYTLHTTHGETRGTVRLSRSIYLWANQQRRPAGDFGAAHTAPPTHTHLQACLDQQTPAKGSSVQVLLHVEKEDWWFLCIPPVEGGPSTGVNQCECRGICLLLIM